MKSGSFSLTSKTRLEFIDISDKLQLVVEDSGIRDGVVMVYSPHTTAGITINEGADPDVQDDIMGVFNKLIPIDYPYKHMEGNSFSHILTTLTGSSATVIIENNRLKLGTWQKIFFCEFDGPRSRKVWWKIIKG